VSTDGMRKILIEESKDGALTATFVPRGAFSLRDLRHAKRALEIGFKNARIAEKIRRAHESTLKEKKTDASEL